MKYSLNKSFFQKMSRAMRVWWNINRKVLFLDTTRSYAKLKTIQFTVINQKGEKIPIRANIGGGDLIFDAMREANVSNYGLCGGCLLCTTCHIIFKPEDFEKVEDPAEDKELLMLKQTLDVTPTSRLGCQVPVTEALDGMEISLPKRTRDARNIDFMNEKNE